MLNQKSILKICEGEKISFRKIIRQTDRFSLILGEKGGKKIVLKILVDPQRKYARSALKKEAQALKFLNNFPGLKAQKFFGSNLKGTYPYYKKEFVLGKTLERKSGFFFQKLDEKIISQLTGSLETLSKISLSLLKQKVKYLSDFGENYFRETFRLHQRVINSFLKKSQRGNFQKLVKEGLINLGRTQKFLVHGEVYPNNIMKDKSRKIYLLDWENLGLGTLAHDTATVFLRIKEKKSKNEFFEKIKFKKREEFKKFFPIEIVLQSIGSLNFFEEEHKKGKIKKIEKEKSQDYFLKMIENFL